MLGSSNRHTFTITLLMKLNETFLDIQSIGFSMNNSIGLHISITYALEILRMNPSVLNPVTLLVRKSIIGFS